MATCEIYVKDVQDRGGLDVDGEAAVMALEAEAAGAERAGLKVQAKLASAELTLRRLGVTPLSAQEFTIWEGWFPTAYRENYQRCECGKAIGLPGSNPPSSYRFDRVPTSVLELMARCRDELKLDWLEIRTPEQNRSQDPGLFGGKGPLTVLLARWGESDNHLLDFGEIQAGLRARNKKSDLGVTAVIPLAILGPITFFAVAIALNDGLGAWVQAPLSAWYVGATVCVIPWSAYCFWRAWRIKKIFAYAFS